MDVQGFPQHSVFLCDLLKTSILSLTLIQLNVGSRDCYLVVTSPNEKTLDPENLDVQICPSTFATEQHLCVCKLEISLH